MTERSDADLLRDARAGDVASFEALTRRHFGLVHSIAYARLREVETTEDLTQEVFLRAHLHLDTMRGKNFPAWLAQITRNLATDWLRRGQTASRLLPMIPLGESEAMLPDPTAKGARETMATQEEIEAMREALFELPESERELVLLHFSEELSQREIAKRLGITQATVSRRIQAALSKLQTLVEPVLREVAPSMRPQERALAKTMAIIVAISAMSTTAKASLATLASVPTVGVASGLGSTVAGIGSTKLIAAVVVAALLAYGGFEMLKTKNEPTTPLTPVVTAPSNTPEPEYTRSSTPRLAQATPREVASSDTTLQSPTRQSRPQGIPLYASTNIDESLRSRVPTDATSLMAFGSPNHWVSNLHDLTDHAPALVNVVNPIALEDTLAQWEVEGVDADKPHLRFEVIDAPLSGYTLSLSDPEVHRQFLEENAQWSPAGASDLWMGGPTLFTRQVFETTTTSLEGMISLWTLGPEARAHLLDLQAAAQYSPLCDLLGLVLPNSVRLVATSDAVDHWRDLLTARMPLLSSRISADGQPLDMARWPWWILGNLSGEMFNFHQRQMAGAPIAMSVTPSEQGLSLTIHHTVTQEIRANALSLPLRLPPEAMLTVSSDLDGGSADALREGIERIHARLFHPDLKVEREAMMDLPAELFPQIPDAQEFAFGYWAPEAMTTKLDRVVLVRTSNRDTRSRLWSKWGSETEREMVAGVEVLHWHVADEELTQPRDPPSLLANQPPLGVVDHWLAVEGDLVILTTEPTPRLMQQILENTSSTSQELIRADVGVQFELNAFLRWFEPLRGATAPEGLPSTGSGITLEFIRQPRGSTTHLNIPAADLQTLVERGGAGLLLGL